MSGIVVIAHAPLASALEQCARHIYSCEPDVVRREVRLLDVDPQADMGELVQRARALVREVDRGNGVLVLTDAFGATPGNVASQLAEAGRVNVVAGVNLPMLLRAVCYRGGGLAELTEKALAGGQQGMLQVGVAAPLKPTPRPQGDDQQRLHDPE
jgi:mannose PTS system EIIA component